jgi:hypothetical protein
MWSLGHARGPLAVAHAGATRRICGFDELAARIYARTTLDAVD